MDVWGTEAPGTTAGRTAAAQRATWQGPSQHITLLHTLLLLLVLALPLRLLPCLHFCVLTHLLSTAARTLRGDTMTPSRMTRDRVVSA